jgi:hypothetical protein
MVGSDGDKVSITSGAHAANKVAALPKPKIFNTSLRFKIFPTGLSSLSIMSPYL